MDENNTQGVEGRMSEFPMRINKYLANEGRGSRREMDKIIELGKVLINGKVAVLGSKVNEGDRVDVRFRTKEDDKKGNQMAHIRRAKKFRSKN